jgi:hypothetical protein
MFPEDPMHRHHCNTADRVDIWLDWVSYIILESLAQDGSFKDYVVHPLTHLADVFRIPLGDNVAELTPAQLQE